MNLFRPTIKWLRTYEPLSQWVYFNAVPIELGSNSVSMISGDRVYRKFVDGTCECELIMSVLMVKLYDATGTSDTNMEALDELLNFSDWLDTQNKVKNYPNFEKGRTISKIECLENVPNLTIDEPSQLAQYRFQIKITYRKDEQ